MTLQQAFDNFILAKRLADLSHKTIENYIGFVTPFIVFVDGKTPVEALIQEDITRYLAMLLDKPVSKATRATYIRHLRVFLKWLSGDYNVQFDYRRVIVPKSPKKRVMIYDSSQVLDLFSSVQTESEWLTKRNQAILCVMYDSGLRQQEVATLKLCNVNFKEKCMVVCGKGNKERFAPLGNTTAMYLKDYLAECPFVSEFVFVGRRGKPLTTNAIKLMVSKLAKNLSFDLSSHKLRHNFATNTCIDQYERNGQMDAYGLMAMMGHANIETTQMYMHCASEVLASKKHISHLDMLQKGV